MSSSASRAHLSSAPTRLWLARHPKCVAAVACTLLLFGCASSAGFQKDGTYLLEKKEKDQDCQLLYKSIWGHTQILKSLPEKARAEQKSASPTAFQMWTRLWASNKGLKAVEEYDRERAHVVALHRTMIDKKCIAFELERELADSDAAIAEIRRQ
jgi:hypothetical protein